ncbi:MAG TPA: HD domain-containing protein [Thermoanaerobaculia bacterium]|nr:HD domain-containing protein [Thermoanaerobaculia bacterium]
MDRDAPLLDLLIELQVLDRVPRMGFLLRGVDDPESVSEHSFHVTLLVWALAEEIPKVDQSRAMAMALLHDLAEVRLGDLPKTTARFLPSETKRAAEAAVFEDLTAPLGERASNLLKEYQEAQSAEAKLVKACDKLALMIKATAYDDWQTGALAEFWENSDNFPAADLPPVERLFSLLRERRAKAKRS